MSQSDFTAVGNPRNGNPRVRTVNTVITVSAGNQIVGESGTFVFEGPGAIELTDGANTWLDLNKFNIVREKNSTRGRSGVVAYGLGNNRSWDMDSRTKLTNGTFTNYCDGKIDDFWSYLENVVYLDNSVSGQYILRLQHNAMLRDVSLLTTSTVGSQIEMHGALSAANIKFRGNFGGVIFYGTNASLQTAGKAYANFTKFDFESVALIENLAMTGSDRFLSMSDISAGGVALTELQIKTLKGNFEGTSADLNFKIGKTHDYKVVNEGGGVLSSAKVKYRFGNSNNADQTFSGVVSNYQIHGLGTPHKTSPSWNNFAFALVPSSGWSALVSSSALLRVRTSCYGYVTSDVTVSSYDSLSSKTDNTVLATALSITQKAEATVKAYTQLDTAERIYDYSHMIENNHDTFLSTVGRSGAILTASKSVVLVGSALYSSTATYAVGDITLHNSTVYKCKTAITVAEAFDASKWDAKTTTVHTLYGEDATHVYIRCNKSSAGFILAGTSSVVVYANGFLAANHTGTISDSAGDGTMVLSLPSGYDASCTAHANRADADAGTNVLFNGSAFRYKSSQYGGAKLWLQAKGASGEIVSSVSIPAAVGVHSFQVLVTDVGKSLQSIQTSVEKLETDMRRVVSNTTATAFNTQRKS